MFHSEDRGNHIKIVAHSAGGFCLSSIINTNPEDFFNIVGKIALTDSMTWHNIPNQIEEEKLIVFKETYKNICIHWVASDLPLGTKLHSDPNECVHMSAGHVKHEFTTG